MAPRYRVPDDAEWESNEDDPMDEYPGKTVVGADREGIHARVLNTQCSTCVFRPGNLMSLSPGRLLDLTGQVRRSQGFVICHQTLEPECEGAICRGSWDRIKTDAIQTFERMGWYREVDPPEKPEEVSP